MFSIRSGPKFCRGGEWVKTTIAYLWTEKMYPFDNQSAVSTVIG